MEVSKYYVSLAHGFGIAGLRALTGAEEQALETSNSLAAIALLNSLLVNTPLASVKPGSAIELPISERDTLLTAVYIDLFGAIIENTITCEACKEKFALRFSLHDIQKTMKASQQKAFQLLGGRLQLSSDHSYTLDAGSSGEVTFRLPTGNDELRVLSEIAGNSSASLMDSCVLLKADGTDGADLGEIEAIIEKIAPFMDVELSADCFQCKRTHSFDFNVQDYLLMKLCSERGYLQQQIHALAINYNWSLKQILRLPRHDRLSLYRLTQNEAVMP